MLYEVITYQGFFRKTNFTDILKGFGIAVVITGIGVGLTFVVKPEVATVTAILTITTLGIVASLVPRINKLKMTVITSYSIHYTKLYDA